MSRQAYIQPIRGYRILERIGSGAMGSVYRARQGSLDRTVALKVIRRENVAGKAFLERLKKEARILARLDHPNIVRVFDMGEDGGYLYLAMELVEGQSLKDLMAEHGPLGEGAVITIAQKVASALDHANRSHVVHRDIKPGNILVGPGGVVKLSDFGLALTAFEPSLTRTGHTVGTPQYIAPEQAGNSRKVDVRSDLYSLGATLYHARTGQFPFRGDSVADVITSVLFETPRPPEELVDGVHPATSRLIAKLMAKRPSKRYPSPQALLDDLARLRSLRGEGRGDAADLGIDWSEVGQHERPWYRRFELVGPAVGLILGLAVVAGMFLTQSDAPEPARATRPARRGPSPEQLRRLWADRELPESEILRLIDAALLDGESGDSWTRLRRDVVTVLEDRARGTIERVVREARAKLLGGDVAAARAYLDRGLALEALLGSRAGALDLRRAVLEQTSGARESYETLERGLLASARDRAAELLQALEESQNSLLARGAFKSAEAALREADYGPFDLELIDRAPGGKTSRVKVHLDGLEKLPPDQARRLEGSLSAGKRQLLGHLNTRLAGRLAEIEAALVDARREVSERIRATGLAGESIEEVADQVIASVLAELDQDPAELGLGGDVVVEDPADATGGDLSEDRSSGDEPGGSVPLETRSSHHGKTLASLREGFLDHLRTAVEQHHRAVVAASEELLGKQLDDLLRGHLYEQAEVALEAASNVSPGFLEAYRERLELLVRLRTTCLTVLDQKVGSVVVLTTSSGNSISKPLVRVDRDRAELALDGLEDSLPLARLSAATLLGLVEGSEDVPSLARAWLLFYAGSIEEAARAAGLAPEGAARDRIVAALSDARAARRRETEVARDRLEDLLLRADSLEASGDLAAARRCVGEWLDDPWIRRIPELRPRIPDVRQRREALGTAIERRGVIEMVRRRFSAILNIAQDGLVEAAYRWRDRTELKDFIVDPDRFVVGEQGLSSRRPAGYRAADIYRNLPGPRLDVRFDQAFPFTVELDYQAVIDSADPEFLGLRVQGICFGIRSFHGSDLAAQINAWKGDLDDFEPYFFDPTLGESRPRRRGFGTRPFESFTRGSRYTLSVEYRPAEGLTLWIEGIERVRAYTIRKPEFADISGVEFRTAVPALFEGLRFRGHIDEQWIRSR